MQCDSNARIGRSRRGGWVAAAGLAALMSASLLAGCGWQPLYARPTPDPASGGVTAKLATVKIDPVGSTTSLDPLTGNGRFPYDARAAQLLQNDLRDAINPYGQPSEPAYHLGITLTETLIRSASLPNGEATRDDLQLSAVYNLTDEKGKPIYHDQARIVTSYDILNEPFNDLEAHNDALERGVQQLALMIQTQLAVFLRK